MRPFYYTWHNVAPVKISVFTEMSSVMSLVLTFSIEHIDQKEFDCVKKRFFYGNFIIILKVTLTKLSVFE